MKLDFWNNPIVVSAFRVKYRRGMPFSSMAAYVILLAGGGAVLEYYKDKVAGHWPQIYFLSIMSIQFVISGLLAASATSASLRAEVTTRTLELQRIAALSPRQILVGKLLGEPAMAYLLAIATVPFGLLCWTWGGVSLGVFLLAYLNLASNTLLFGCLGLLTNLDASASKSGATAGRGPEWVVFMLVIGPIFMVPAFVALAPKLIAMPWAGSLVGLVTPVPAFYAIVHDDLWQYPLTFFGLQLPAVCITPLAQLVIGYLCFQGMVRQLINPLNPTFNKKTAYVVLLVVDLLFAAVLDDPVVALRLPLATQVTIFCLTHFVASLGLTLTITPWREALESWIWRFRGRRSRLVDAWLGERSENGLALLTFCAIGVLIGWLLIVLPARWAGGGDELVAGGAGMIAAMLTLIVLTLAFGSLYQWIVFLAGRGSLGTLLGVVGIFFVVPHLLGYYFDLDWLTWLSPSAQFGEWIQGKAPVQPLVVLLAAYGLVTTLVRISLHRRLNYLERVVDLKLKIMGVVEPVR